jgi:hypothetical protein
MVRVRMNKAGANSHPVPLFDYETSTFVCPKDTQKGENKEKSHFFEKK